MSQAEDIMNHRFGEQNLCLINPLGDSDLRITTLKHTTGFNYSIHNPLLFLYQFKIN